MGEGRARREADRRNGVDVGHHVARKHRRNRRRVGQIGAHIDVRLHPQRQYFAVLIESHFGVVDLVAGMGVGEETLGAVGDPFDRTAELTGGPGDQSVFGIARRFHAEPAPDVVGDDTDIGFGQVKHIMRNQLAQVKGELGAGIDRIPAAGRIVIGNQAPGLHRVGGQTVVAEL